MEHSQYPSTAGTKGDAALAREIYRAYLEELSAITDYTYARILTEKDLPAAAALFADIAMDEMEHFLQLGRLLQNWCYSPAVDTRVRQAPIRLLCDRDSHVPAVTRRLLVANAAEERRAAANYRALAEKAGAGTAHTLLTQIAAEEEAHADAQKALERRLAGS